VQGAADILYLVEIGDSPSSLSYDPEAVEEVSVVSNSNGTDTVTYRDVSPVSAHATRFMRLRIAVGFDDTDGNGVPDDYELAMYGSLGNPGASTRDDNSNGLSDWWENVWGTYTANGDSDGNIVPDGQDDWDGDGDSNAVEAANITNPYVNEAGNGLPPQYDSSLLPALRPTGVNVTSTLIFENGHSWRHYKIEWNDNSSDETSFTIESGDPYSSY
jgi:hypothetical protein